MQFMLLYVFFLFFFSLFFFYADHQGTIPRWDEENSLYQEGDRCCFFKEGRYLHWLQWCNLHPHQGAPAHDL